MTLNSRYLVKPVRKALQLLEELEHAGQPLTLSELAERTGLPKTTAFRYLYTLRAARLVLNAKDGNAKEGDAYKVGPRLATSSAPEGVIGRLKDTAMPEMRGLQNRFNETVNLAINDRGAIVYVAIVGSTRSLRIEASIGARDPLHATSLGKAILAARDAAHRLDGLPSRLARRTPETLTSRDALQEDLARAAKRGFALDLQENELGAHCVAAAIPSALAEAAISISGPVQRLPPEKLERCGAALVRAALQIAARLG